MINIVIVGLGTLGSRIALNLANQSNINLTGIDRDIVAPENLGNQHYTEKDLNLPKPLALQKQVPALNPIADELNETTTHYLNDADLILDGLDNMETRQLIAHIAQKNSIPYIYGAAAHDKACVAAFTKDTTTFASIFKTNAQGLTCVSAGITSQAAEWCASKQVELAKRIIEDQQSQATLFYYDNNTIHELKLPNTAQEITPPTIKSTIIKLCGKNLYQAWIKENKAKNLTNNKPFVKKDNVTIFPNGRILVQAESEQDAKVIVTNF